MNEPRRLLARRIAKLGAQSNVTTRIVRVKSISGSSAIVTMSGKDLEAPIPMDKNLNLVVGSYARMQIEDGVARIVAKQA